MTPAIHTEPQTIVSIACGPEDVPVVFGHARRSGGEVVVARFDDPQVRLEVRYPHVTVSAFVVYDVDDRDAGLAPASRC